jgi:hypothetical protein
MDVVGERERGHQHAIFQVFMGKNKRKTIK